MLLHRSLALVLLGALVVSCANEASAPDSSGINSPPITESESGRIVDQSFEVHSFTVEVTSEGSAVFAVTGSLPSPCHEATFGFEEPNAAGVMIGESESWVDPGCEATPDPTEVSETMEVPGLPPGDYVARLDGEFETDFVIPPQETVSPSTTAFENPSPSDLSLVAYLVEFAKNPSEESFAHLPLAGSVDLGLGPQLVRSVDAQELRDPQGWVLEVEFFRAYTGPFSPLEVLGALDDYTVQIGEHDHCAGPPKAPPDGLEELRRVSVQPSSESIDSCLTWATVDVFVNPSGRIKAITMDLWEP